MRILHNNNPIDPAYGTTPHDLPDGITGNQAFKAIGIPKSQAVVLIVDGQAWGRADWDKPLPAGAVIVFTDIQQGTVFGIVIAVLAIASAGYAYYMASQMPDTAVDIGTPSSIYSFSTGANRLRIGKPFAEPFGRLQIYPDLAQQSYVQNIDNDQYLYFLGIVGVGEYDVEGVYIENTLLTDYADSSYNIIGPGGSFSLIPNVVWTCNEVSNQELDTDWVTYVVSASGTESYYLEYDITFSGGLVEYKDDGGKCSLSVEINTQVRTVDTAGVALTGWTDLDTYTYIAESKDPLRYSRKIAAPYGAGRYQFRAKRASEASGSSRKMDKVILSGLRAYGGTHPDYSATAGLDLTMIECKIKASDQLSGDCGSQINVIATRKLYPVTSTGFGASLSATQNIADICAYIVTSYNGGRQDDSIIDFATLYAMRNVWVSNTHTFNYKFTGRLSVMEACAKAAACDRAVPYMPGGKFTLVFDGYKPLPSCVFTRDNISDLVITSAPRTPDSTTCIIVTYINPATWKEEEVLCLDENGSEDNPYEMNLEGCTIRNQAYVIGMYMYNRDRLERTSVEFTTGLMGNIPSLLSKVLVSNTMINWGQDGLIVSYNSGDELIWLSEPVDFLGADEGAIYICAPNGDSAGPYAVYPSADTHAVSGTIPDILTIENDDLKATRYLFGPSTFDPMFIRVEKIQPQGKDKIKIQGTLMNDDIFEYVDDPDDPTDPTGKPGLLESISLLNNGEDTGGYIYIVSWVGSTEKVLIELSEDSGGYYTLEDEYTLHSLTFNSFENIITVKITPYDGTVLSPENALTKDFEVPLLPAPTGLSVIFNSDGLYVSFDPYGESSYTYKIYVYVDDEEVMEMVSSSAVTTSITNFSYVASAGGPWNEITVYLSVLTADGESDPASIVAEYAGTTSPIEPVKTGSSLATLTNYTIIYSGGV
jgi:hypothetical protein